MKESCDSALEILFTSFVPSPKSPRCKQRIKVLIISNYQPITSVNGFIVQQIHQPGCQNRSEI